MFRTLYYQAKRLKYFKHILNVKLNTFYQIKPKKAHTRTMVCSAVGSKQVIQFCYQDEGLRLAEPYCYGVMPDGSESLLCYQIGGYSKFSDQIGWKLFRSSGISLLEVLDEHFTCATSENDVGYARRYSAFKTIYCQVIASVADEADEAESKKSVTLERSGEREGQGHEHQEKYARHVQSHNERMRRFRFNH